MPLRKKQPAKKQLPSKAIAIPRVVSAYQELRVISAADWTMPRSIVYIIVTFDDGSTWEMPNAYNENRWRIIVPSRATIQRDFNTFFALTQTNGESGDNGNQERT